MTSTKWRLAGLGAISSLVFSACTVPAALSQTHATLGADPYLQVHFSLAVSGPGAATAREAKLLKGLTFSVLAQSTSGSPLRKSLHHDSQELTIWRGATHVATVSDIKANLYVDVNFAALAHVPGVTLSTSEISAAELFLGGRWIEFPYGLLSKYSSTTLHHPIKQDSLVASEFKAVDALVTAFASGSVTNTTTGLSETGTLASLDAAVTRLIKNAGIAAPTTPKGSYHLTVTKAGVRATGFSFSVTTPDAKLGDATATVAGTITHRSVAVKAPLNPLVLTPALIRQLGTLASGSLG